MTARRSLVFAVVSLTACSDGTSVLVRITGPGPLAWMSAEVSVDTVNATRQWATPQLPATLVVRLSDISADVDVTISAVDVAGGPMGQRASVRSVPHRQVTVEMALSPNAGGDGGAIGDASADGASDLSTPAMALRSASSDSVLNTSPLSISQPSGTSAGDVLVAAVYLGYGTAGSLPTITPSVSWTLIDRVDYSTTGSLLLYWRAAGTSEPASYTWSSSGGGNTSGVGWIGAYTGVDATNPVNAHGSSSSGTASTSCTTPSLTTTAPNTILVASFAGYFNASGTATWSLPPGMSLIKTLNNGDNRSGLGSTVVQPASGSTGTFTATVSPSQSFCLSHLLALNPN